MYCYNFFIRNFFSSARLEIESAALLSKDSNDGSSVPASSLQRTLQEIESSILSEKQKLGNQELQSQINKNGASASVVKNKPTGTPEYNPTPLNELKEQKSKGQLGSGRSKYDLALLDGPDTDGEYDPASNFSTPLLNTGIEDQSVSSGNTNLPEYARQLSGSLKRKVENPDDQEEESPLAKIPKFVSVDYTPTLLDTSQLSDEESEPAGTFSDDQSDKGNESDVAAISDADAKPSIGSGENRTNKSEESSGSNNLPLEFTAEGFVKCVKKATEQVKKVPEPQEDELSRDSKSKPADKKSDNIFNMFKEEFDNALESCDPALPKEETSKVHKVKLKESAEKTHTSSSNSSKSVSDKKSHSKLSSKSDHSAKSSDKSKDKVNSHSHHKHSSSHKHESHHKHSSKESTKNSVSEHHKSGTSDKTVVKNGTHKSVHLSSASKHSSSTSSSSMSKHHSSSSSNHHKDLKDSSKHSSQLKSTDAAKHKHRSSSSEQKSSDKHKNNSNHEHKSLHGHEHKSIHSHEHKSNHSHTHNSNHSKEKTRINSSKHDSSHSKDKTKVRTSEKSSKSGKSGGDKSGKKQILNLDVDLFGAVESENGDSPRHDSGDDLGDLEKFFEEDPFDECLRIFNEESSKQTVINKGDKKVCSKPLVKTSTNVQCVD